ncbi:pyridine nucleotide-disulfide oxidoreductase [Thiocapsa imhoffii]|uniref:Pyridine nucleotide-disulfide oxidoreductase n=1 Tax=Thiocapsa imhoffii TaxID=382777 RepID=A0A9X0WKM3_9GAMM|nr:bifunctional TVP38/TMEM64 family protein/FAD-dependent oxidoreductase [Thiocapsa imhoffii]MBK1646454.1 pyridine nucleotide-disulfide oxidoreductase [Thiocapsa imhoffii]
MKQLALLVLILVAVGAFFAFDLDQSLTLDALKASQATFDAWYAARPALVIGVFFVGYVAVTALSLPGATIMTLAAGALFGLGVGTLVVSFASSIGATLAFLVSRFLLRDAVQRRFSARLATLNQGIEKDGAFYLFTLRLVPIFPFFVINLLMGLTPIKTFTFYWVSQIGMLAATLVFVNAGTQLARLDSLSSILSPALLGSFALLGVFPLLAKWVVNRIKARRVYADWPRPRRFDRNLVVIGAGSGGLVSAYLAAAVKAKVTLIEGQRMGGDCLNTGCVPSKALIRSARFLRQVRRAERLGVVGASAEVDFARIMGRVHRVIAEVEPHDSVERYTALGVEVIQGQARLVSPWSVAIDTPTGARTLTSRAIVIATGAAPIVPDIPGLDRVRHVTSEDLWSITEKPERLLVLGGGPIGCELAQAFAGIGCRVTQVARSGILPKEDADTIALIEAALREEGVRLLTHTRTLRCEVVDGEQRLVVTSWPSVHPLGAQLDERTNGAEDALPFDLLLCAIGRRARVTGFGLEALGIPLTAAGTIETNAYLQTRYPNILACGDVVGPHQFTHVAAHQAWSAAVNGLFLGIKRFKVDNRVIPRVTFTDPEVAQVGLTERQAQARGIAYEVTRYELHDLDRAITESAGHGFVKVLTPPGKDRILGACIVGEHAGELLAEFTLAMKHGLGLERILGTVHPYPTWSEAAKYAAGNWKRAHAPQTALVWLGRFHAWRRG